MDLGYQAFQGEYFISGVEGTSIDPFTGALGIGTDENLLFIGLCIRLAGENPLSKHKPENKKGWSFMEFKHGSNIQKKRYHDLPTEVQKMGLSASSNSPHILFSGSQPGNKILAAGRTRRWQKVATISFLDYEITKKRRFI